MINTKNTMVFLLLVSIVICAISFYSFNHTKEINFPIEKINMVDVNGNIELCEITNNSLKVTGWIIPRKYMGTPYKGNNYIISNINGEFKKIKTERTLRKDVSLFYKVDKIYDYTGASSGYKSISNKKISNKIILVTEKNGQAWGISRECK